MKSTVSGALLLACIVSAAQGALCPANFDSEDCTTRCSSKNYQCSSTDRQGFRTVWTGPARLDSDDSGGTCTCCCTTGRDACLPPYPPYDPKKGGQPYNIIFERVCGKACFPNDNSEKCKASRTRHQSGSSKSSTTNNSTTNNSSGNPWLFVVLGVVACGLALGVFLYSKQRNDEAQPVYYQQEYPKGAGNYAPPNGNYAPLG